SAPAELAAGTRPDAAVTYSSPKMSVSTAEAAVSPDAHAVAPVVSAKPIEASAPSAPAELAAGTRPDAAVTYSSPKMSVSTADAAVSPDAHAVAPIVSAKPIEASAPSAPAELAAGTRPDAAVTYSSPKMSVSTADAAVSPDAHAVAPIVSAKPIEASAPLVPAELAAAVRPDAAVTYSSPKMSVSTADATVSPDAHAEAPVLVARALPASEPSVPAEFAKSSRPDAVVTLPPSALRTSTPDTAASQDAHAVAPVVSTKPIEESVPVAPAELAHKSAAQPAVSVGSQILASAGYTPSRVDPNIVLKAPFMLKKPEFAPPTDTPPENATLAHPSAMSPQIPSVTYAMASTKLSVSPVSSQSLDAPSVSKEAAPMSAPSLATGARRAGVVVAPAPSKMASAAVNISPDGTGSLSLPSFAAPRTDMTNVPHASVLVARPASGLFSASVRHKLAGQYEVVMDDRSVALDRPIQDHGNVLCAPIRQIVESQGGVLFWSQKTKSVRALTPNRDIQLQIGSTLAKVNDQDQKLSTAPYVTGGRTMIPVGFLPLALNVVVNYDAATGHLQIDSKD
ncbi:MAG: stalk domain-containing protein, partial [Capsulimonadaceae bacterium]|nr:stalk domain-containing protein [Capsulimonadaceae bacterium]